MNKNYNDIINLPHHVSKTRPKMSLEQRSAQFASFAALNGYEEEIAETGRLTDCRIEIDEKIKFELDRKLNIIKSKIAIRPKIMVMYFVPDEKKDGGSYVKFEGKVRKIDEYNKKLVFMDSTQIPLSEIIEIICVS